MSDKKKSKTSSTFKKLMVIIGALALLAALLIPAMLIFMDKATEKQYQIHAKSAYTAAQAVAWELYSKGGDPSSITEEKYIREINKKADLDSVKCTSFKIGYQNTSYDSDKESSEQPECFTIQYVEYTEDGVTVSFNGNKWDNFSSLESDLLIIK